MVKLANLYYIHVKFAAFAMEIYILWTEIIIFHFNSVFFFNFLLIAFAFISHNIKTLY